MSLSTLLFHLSGIIFDTFTFGDGNLSGMNLLSTVCRGRGTGEASEATASPEFRGFTTEKFLAS